MIRQILLLGCVSALTAELTDEDKENKSMSNSEFITIVLSTILGLIVVIASCLVVICIKWGDDFIDHASEVISSRATTPQPSIRRSGRQHDRSDVETPLFSRSTHLHPSRASQRSSRPASPSIRVLSVRQPTGQVEDAVSCENLGTVSSVNRRCLTSTPVPSHEDRKFTFEGVEA